MSEGEVGGSPMALPADSLIRSVDAGKKREGLPWLAMIAAALLHALVLLWLLIDWQHPTPPPPEPKIVPIQIVTVPPSPPPPSRPAPKPAPPPAFRESGPDQRTTAPPPAETVAPKPAAPSPSAPEQSTQPAEAPPLPPPEKPSTPEQAGRPVPRKDRPQPTPQKQEAATPRALHPAPRRLNVEPGERFESGDPYLNQLHALIERHRVYPRVIGPFGLPVEGTAIYDLAVDRDGKIIGMKLEHSSGVAGIDQAVANMIRSALPFPPLPSDYPDDVVITVSIRLFPPS